ncbi:hypothetical protein CANCADRAFT_22964 [Tortispora caseinolytica NRRL Y-17796]|uniref:CDC45-like protein n=1 Tax=Tortispora caseinolytica NRRL Y-17796 TaxID=767744 RepID=A0A1E4TJC3_9ASCO|nr:hypothetical protein CANCADRAFT_22964 [Tortispora caseinolytica NRRL Y-17796]
MLITQETLLDEFERLRSSSLSHATCKASIFVACADVDALCAAKCLSLTFKHDLIPHRICPVAGFSDAGNAYSSLDDDIVNVIFIGFGALVDLPEYFNINSRLQRYHYIIDGRRPWHLNNIDSEFVRCIDLNPELSLIEPARHAWSALKDVPDVSDSDTDSDTDFDDDFASSQDEDTDTESENDEDNPDRKHRRAKRKVRRVRTKYEDEINSYHFMDTYIVASTSSQVYGLLSELGRTSNSYLWLAVVGTTALDDIAPAAVQEAMPVFKDEVARLNSEIQQHLNAADNQALTLDTDFRLFLLRHWSLYNALIHSKYVCTRLHLWRQSGRSRVKRLLAHMGISIISAKENWVHTDMELKKTLADRFRKVSANYDIESIIVEGIFRKFGFRGKISARDAVDAIAALLESGRPHSLADSRSLPTPQSSATSSPDHGAKVATDRDKMYVEHFWAGWDSVDDINLLKYGVEKAQILEEAVLRTGAAIMESKTIRELRVGYLVAVRDSPDQNMFLNPIAIMRLAQWISHAVANLRKPRPMILAILDKATDTYMAVGLPSPVGMSGVDDEDEEDLNQKNAFRIGFQEAAERTEARYRIDGFESATIQIRRQDFSTFMEALVDFQYSRS